MPTSIVAATCPVPECKLLPRDVESLVVELEAYAGQFLSAFARADQYSYACHLAPHPFDSSRPPEHTRRGGLSLVRRTAHHEIDRMASLDRAQRWTWLSVGRGSALDLAQR